MPTIVTLTLSPALDKSTTVAGLVPDHKLRCTAPVIQAGGGGINVSRGLRRLGSLSVAVFPAGGPTGSHLQELLTAEHIAQTVVPTKMPTRENFVVTDTTTQQQYRFGLPSVHLSAAEQHLLLEKLSHFMSPPKFLVVSGSLPPGVPPGFLAKVVRQARAVGTKVIVDTAGPALRQAVDAGAYLIKPNLHELSRLAGVAELDRAAVAAAARRLIGRTRCQAVVVSLGAEGACLITHNSEEHIPAPAVLRRSTVGAGDSMVAGIVHALAQDRTFAEAARLGVACGTAATMNPGTELFHCDDAHELYKQLRHAQPAEYALN
ncbi:1-phosphofructokinase family hexose kinase [Hymenobacter sp. DH14]|uniref:1-phosphofructokinase family hexose kinase n=1 Tax=Hymenobacter cyanobacteriorum TaxID=2926463 RepID=A0A9X1VH10_9BACT|nr:1-phosphofructokinase family hexose kinase [Hymenobacter cyanobacteriorum]MCI1188637.1 1-phosphofructokinase family hexose kinase [Hymenobacter cyanobacteriorum]